MKKLIAGFICLSLFTACEEVPIEINDVIIPETKKVVLLEELTGASCPNCPKGTQAAENILTKYPDNVIAVGIHGNFLASPAKSGDPDFRNEDSKNLENWFKPWFGKPCASVNRSKTSIAGTDYFIHEIPDLWESVVEEELQKPLLVNLFMDVKYNESTRVVDIEVACNPVQNVSGDYNITIYVLESHIKAAQANGSEIIVDYEHNHVLRKTITQYQGDFFAKDMLQGQILKKNYSYILPAEDGLLNHPEHTSIVAFIHKSGSNERDILQAASAYLIE